MLAHFSSLGNWFNEEKNWEEKLGMRKLYISSFCVLSIQETNQEHIDRNPKMMQSILPWKTGRQRPLIWHQLFLCPWGEGSCLPLGLSIFLLWRAGVGMAGPILCDFHSTWQNNQNMIQPHHHQRDSHWHVQVWLCVCTCVWINTIYSMCRHICYMSVCTNISEAGTKRGDRLRRLELKFTAFILQNLGSQITLTMYL